LFERVGLFTLSPCGRGWLREAKPGEGYLSVETDPSSGADYVRAAFSHKGRREGSLVFFILRRN
jgi:hypothetical protein